MITENLQGGRTLGKYELTLQFSEDSRLPLDSFILNGDYQDITHRLDSINRDQHDVYRITARNIINDIQSIYQVLDTAVKFQFVKTSQKYTIVYVFNKDKTKRQATIKLLDDILQ